MKKLLSIFTAVLMLAFALYSPITAIIAENEYGCDSCQYDECAEIPATLGMISDLDLDPSISFLSDYEIEVPNLFENEASACAFVLSTVNMVLYESCFESLYSASALIEFSNQIIQATIDHYEIDASSLQERADYLRAETLSSGLQENTLVLWNSTCKRYNCYSYALKRSDAVIDPGSVSGNSSMLYSYLQSGNVAAVANLVVEDLNALGYSCVRKTTTRPSVSGLSSNQTLICLRLDTDQSTDYHFMRYVPSSEGWQHKPGLTAILRYNYIPSNSRDWLSEGYNGSAYISSGYTYDSTIYYFVYSTTHNTSVSDYSSSAHKISCSNCSYSKIEAHIANAAQTACKICGHPAPFTAMNSIGDNSAMVYIIPNSDYKKEELK